VFASYVGKCSVQNEGKDEEIILKLCSLLSQDLLEKCASNLIRRFATFGGISAANLVEFR